MATWTADDRTKIGNSVELRLASQRADGTLRPYVTIWVVRVGNEVYVRSAYGPDSGWFRRASASGRGRIRAGGIERDVTFAAATDGPHAEIDAAYHAKYDHYGPRIVGTVVGEQAAPLTLRLVPRDNAGRSPD